eukprot:1691872-Prymnesium_polylepis.1
MNAEPRSKPQPRTYASLTRVDAHKPSARSRRLARRGQAWVAWPIVRATRRGVAFQEVRPARRRPALLS